jgi:hypothetical protein
MLLVADPVYPVVHDPVVPVVVSPGIPGKVLMRPPAVVSAVVAAVCAAFNFKRRAWYSASHLV